MDVRNVTAGGSKFIIEVGGSFGGGGGESFRAQPAPSLLAGEGFHLQEVWGRRADSADQPGAILADRAGISPEECSGGTCQARPATAAFNERARCRRDRPSATSRG